MKMNVAFYNIFMKHANPELLNLNLLMAKKNIYIKERPSLYQHFTAKIKNLSRALVFSQ